MKALNRIEDEDTNTLFKVDVLTAFDWVCVMWQDIDTSTIYSCCAETGLVGNGLQAKDEEQAQIRIQEEHGQISNLLQQTVTSFAVATFNNVLIQRGKATAPAVLMNFSSQPYEGTLDRSIVITISATCSYLHFQIAIPLY